METEKQFKIWKVSQLKKDGVLVLIVDSIAWCSNKIFIEDKLIMCKMQDCERYFMWSITESEQRPSNIRLFSFQSWIVYPISKKKSFAKFGIYDHY